MPNQDKTGPQGKGPITGRGLGSCAKGKTTGRSAGQGVGLRQRLNKNCPFQKQDNTLSEK